MEVEFSVPRGTDISMIERAYGDLSFDDFWEDEEGVDFVTYFIGDADVREEEECFNYEDAAEFCGFVEGALPMSTTLMEGYGPWAMGELLSDDDYRRGYRRGLLMRRFTWP